jgi:hypothetical protein
MPWPDEEPRWGGPLRTPPALLPQPGERVDAERRERILDWAVTQYVARGWRVESRSEAQVVLARTGQVNHVGHLIATLATCFVWLLGWIVVTLVKRTDRVVVRVDDWGRLHEAARSG